MEALRRTREFFTKLGKKEKRLSIHDPQSAALKVFEEITKNEQYRDYVLRMGKIFTGQDYTPLYTGNNMLTHGKLSQRWFDPEDLNTVTALHNSLRRIFSIKLTGDPVLSGKEFVESLGKHVSELVTKSESIEVI